MNSLTSALAYCLLLGVIVYAWPHLRHSEFVAWDVHRDKCIERYAKNAKFLKTGVCDEGAHELDNEGTHKDCERIRSEQRWGIQVCTVWSVVKSHTISEFIRHLWNSWYAFGVFVFLSAVFVNGFWTHMTATSIHKASLASQTQSLDNLLLHSSQHVAPPVQRPQRISYPNTFLGGQ